MADYTEEDKQKVLEQLSKKTWKIPELAKILKMDKKSSRKLCRI